MHFIENAIKMPAFTFYSSRNYATLKVLLKNL